MTVEYIDIQYRPGAHELFLNEVGDWIDLFVYEDTFIKKDEQVYIDLGVAMKLPKGYEAIVVPRSSTFKRWGVLQTNSQGVIDSSFAGPDDYWQFPALATRDVLIPAGTRICQFRIQKNQPKIIFNEVARLNNKTRGGFGSTGA